MSETQRPKEKASTLGEAMSKGSELTWGISFLLALGISMPFLSPIAEHLVESDSSTFATLFFMSLPALVLWLPVVILCCYMGWLGWPKVMSAAERFYLACKKENITNLSSPATKEKIKLIAKNLGISGDIEALLNLYIRGQEMVDSDLRQNKLSELSKIREKELEEKRQLEKFTHYVGREKRQAMIRDEIANLRSELSNYSSDGSFLYKKESDWAISGGIASGLAGTGAGVASAINTQRKNAEVRSYNRSIAPLVSQIDQYNWSQRKRIQETIKRREDALNRVPMLLVEPLSKEEPLDSYININNSEISVTETGSVYVKVSVKAKELYKIYGEKNAVLDGFFQAMLSDKQGHKSSVLLTLPTFGLNTKREATLIGICTEFNDAQAKYDLTLSNENLWLIEG